MIELLADQSAQLGVSGETVLWVFGIVLGVIGALVGVIWKMLNDKIDKNEDNFRRDLAEIEARGDKDRESTRGIVQRIFDKLEQVQRDISDLRVSQANSLHRNRGDSGE